MLGLKLNHVSKRGHCTELLSFNRLSLSCGYLLFERVHLYCNRPVSNHVAFLNGHLKSMCMKTNMYISNIFYYQRSHCLCNDVHIKTVVFTSTYFSIIRHARTSFISTTCIPIRIPYRCFAVKIAKTKSNQGPPKNYFHDILLKCISSMVAKPLHIDKKWNYSDIYSVLASFHCHCHTDNQSSGVRLMESPFQYSFAHFLFN